MIRLVILASVSGVAAAMNAVAGGGMLLVFPALVASGVPPVVANATCTVALWPGALGSAWGFRHLIGAEKGWARRSGIAGVLGGTVGASLLTRASPEAFAAEAPWLVLAATPTFAGGRLLLQGVRALEGRGRERRRPVPRLSPALVVALWLAGCYGGFFGAGIGILILALLVLSGHEDLHLLNALKVWSALCINVVARSSPSGSSVAEHSSPETTVLRSRPERPRCRPPRRPL